MKTHADILDVCCGARQFWFDKAREDVIFMDIREGEYSYKSQSWAVKPDVIGDFRSIPFDDDTFELVIFDPPHITHGSDNSIMAQKYGKLDKSTWREDIKKGLSECFRVCKPNGFINFKWSGADIPLSEIRPLFPAPPLYGQKRFASSTVWLMFRKGAE